MNRILTLIIILKMLASVAHAQLVEKYCNPSAINDYLAYCVDQLDPLKDQHWRAQITNGYRTKFGTQIHSNCFNLAKKFKHSEAQTKKIFDDALSQAFQTVLNDCSNRYSPLRNYFLEWIAQARRTVITCSSKVESVSQESQAVCPSNALYLEQKYEAEAYSGINDLIGALNPLAGNHKSIIVIPIDHKNQEYSLSKSFLVSNIIHEIFHSTHLNNRSFSHNSVERKFPSQDDDLCDENFLDDRVFSMTALCTNDDLSNRSLNEYVQNKKIVEFFYDRMNQCGRKKGCINLFLSSSVFFSTPWMPSQPLTKTEAQQTCQLIYDQGYCEKTRKLYLKDPEGVLALNKQYQSLMVKINEKLKIYKNQDPNYIPASWLTLFPAIKNGFDSFSNTACYQYKFIKNSDGSLKIKNQNFILDFIKNEIAQCQNNSGRQIEQLLSELRGNVQNIFFTLTKSVTEVPPLNSELRLALGSDLYFEFRNLLLKINPNSLQFNCYQAGWVKNNKN